MDIFIDDHVTKDYSIYLHFSSEACEMAKSLKVAQMCQNKRVSNGSITVNDFRMLFRNYCLDKSS